MNTEYAILKQHFDKLLVGGFSGTGLEGIRDVYERMFNRRINLYDVYQTNLRFNHNPVGSIITLVGPDLKDDDPEIPEGFMPYEKGIGLVSLMSDDILKGVRSEDANWYSNAVYKAIDSVISKDPFYGGDMAARNNPHTAFLRLAPFYFTYHHLDSCAPSAIDYDVLHNLVEKYITTDDIDKIIDTVKKDKYTTEEEGIYYTMSAHNSIECIF